MYCARGVGVYLYRLSVATLTAQPTWDFTQFAPGASAKALSLASDDLAAAALNVCHLRLLERIATRFEAAGIPLMVLKGAALHLTVLNHPGDRPMTDIDLMVRPAHADRAIQLLRELRCRPGRPLVRADFFPRFYYETEFTAGRVLPLRIDLHVPSVSPLALCQGCFARCLLASWRARARRLGDRSHTQR